MLLKYVYKRPKQAHPSKFSVGVNNQIDDKLGTNTTFSSLKL